MPYANRSNVRIHFTVVGDGPPLLLHTGAGGDGSMWTDAGYVARLRDYRCILIDHRGHGMSDRPRGIEDHLIDSYVGDVLAVLDDLDIERAAFWGYSAGGWVGYALAASHPARVTALITSGAVPSADLNEPTVREGALARARLVRQQGVAHLLKPLEAVEGTAFPQWFWDQMNRTDSEMFALQVEGSSRWVGPSSVQSRILCPVLMLVGELEDPDGDAPRVAPLLANARVVTFPGLGHVSAYVRSDLALDHAQRFLASTLTSS